MRICEVKLSDGGGLKQRAFLISKLRDAKFPFSVHDKRGRIIGFAFGGGESAWQLAMHAESISCYENCLAAIKAGGWLNDDSEVG